MATDNGVFSEKMFHHDVFDTGWRNIQWWKDRDKVFDLFIHKNRIEKIKQEDFEIIEFIITITESGMLEE